MGEAVTPSKPLTPTEPSRGTICKCGLAKSYHFGPGPNLADHEYEPRYPARRTLDATQAVEPDETVDDPRFKAWLASHHSGMHWSCMGVNDPPMCNVERLAAARSSSAPAELPELDAAWKEAWAGVPTYINGEGAAHLDEEWGEPEDYVLAVMQKPGEKAIAWLYDPSTDPAAPEFALAGDYGDSPAAALRALAARLTSSPENPA